ncbi:helix-turn-helix transcriptional regulator [Dysosmobacter sp.]|jgi:transcriptional regulator with XRE-family HTH domain|uniref:helix-turn-helix transcriptional regulator n=1 Tax=Dysosmobacter sp. TaxID=2591382 RepID=UPI003D92DC8E
MTFSQRLSQARKARGLNQETLAHQVGVSRQAVSKWETGDALPDLPRLLALADALELPLDDLCGRKLPLSPSQPPAPASTPTPESTFLPDSSQSAPPPCPDSILARLRLRRVLPLVIAFFLGAALTLGALWGLRQSQLVPSQAASAADLPEAFTVSGLSFSSQGGTLSYTFTPSMAAPGITYQISFTNSQGDTETFDPALDGGVCTGTAALDPLESYQVTVTAQTATAQRSLAVAVNLTFGDSRADWIPLEEIP